MSKPRVLVTGAAGRTGAPATMELLANGFPVRTLVRRRNAPTEALAAAGAEVVLGDLLDYRDVRGALDGVQRAYLCLPFGPNLLHTAAVFALAAEDAKLEVVALMSQWLPHPSDPSFVTREHWLANHVLRWMPSVDVVHVNPGLFAFFYLLGLPAILHMGMLAAPFGDGMNAPPSNEDIGRVAAAVLMNPASHIGKSYRPTGPELLSPTDIAGILSRVVGRRVTYRDLPFKMFAKAARAQGIPLSQVSQMRHYAEALKGGAFALGAPSEHVQEVTGAAPETFESIARRYIADPTLIDSSARAGSSLGALSLALRILMTPAPDLDAFERDSGYPLLRNPVQAYDSAEWRASAERGQLHLQGVVAAAEPLRAAS